MLGLLGTIVIAQLSAISRPDSTSLEARWRREYPQAAVHLRQATEQYISFGKIQRQSFTGKVIVTKNLTFAQDNGQRLLIRDNRYVQSTKEPLPSDVLCISADRAFLLKKPIDSNQYFIVTYATPTEFYSLGDQLDMLLDNYVGELYTFRGRTLIDRLSDPTFHVLSMKVLEGNDETIELNFACGSREENERGKIVLCPNLFWSIRSYDIKANVPIKKTDKFMELHFVGDMEAQLVNEKVPFLKKYHKSVTKPRADFAEDTTIDFDTVTPGPVSPTHFKLTGYGLPDIPLKSINRTSFFSLGNPWLWGSAVIAIIAFSLQSRIFRKSK